MSAIKIIKGLPITFNVGVSYSNTAVNLNDDTWNTTMELRWQTVSGNTPFDLTVTPSGNGYLVEITDEQTSSLNHKGSGYVLVIRASKTDASVNIRNVIPVSVFDDI